MVRRVIHIDQEKCNGCGICANACHEGAIGIVDGKAQLLRDDYCDGLGDCLPTCPTGAITFVEREAAAYDEEAVRAHMERRKQEQAAGHGNAHQAEAAPAFTGCPGSRARQIVHEGETDAVQNETPAAPFHLQSQLTNWPVQIKLVPTRAPYFDGAELLIAADCTAFAYADFHSRFLAGRVCLIGCPKLDGVDYTGKLAEILRDNSIRSVTVLRMEVPCCGGLEMAARRAVEQCGKDMPWQVCTVHIDGTVTKN